MIKRCYLSKQLEYKRTYIGCTVCEEWLSFMNFRAWMVSQDWVGKRLDKDLLVTGNKEYSPDNCTFISNRINCFLTNCHASSGYCWDVRLEKFHARVSNPFTGCEVHLGYFSSEEEAKEVWLNAKLEIGERLAKEGGLPPEIVTLLTDKEVLCQYLNIQC